MQIIFYATAPTRQHGLDHTRSGIFLPLKDLDHEVGIYHREHDLFKMCNIVRTQTQRLMLGRSSVTMVERGTVSQKYFRPKIATPVLARLSRYCTKTDCAFVPFFYDTTLSLNMVSVWIKYCY